MMEGENKRVSLGKTCIQSSQLFTFVSQMERNVMEFQSNKFSFFAKQKEKKK